MRSVSRKRAGPVSPSVGLSVELSAFTSTSGTRLVRYGATEKDPSRRRPGPPSVDERRGRAKCRKRDVEGANAVRTVDEHAEAHATWIDGTMVRGNSSRVWSPWRMSMSNPGSPVPASVESTRSGMPTFPSTKAEAVVGAIDKKDGVSAAPGTINQARRPDQRVGSARNPEAQKG